MGSNDPIRLTARTEGVAARKASAPSEPPTGRALWPTFMRRTLAEEELPAPAPREVCAAK
ncbi:hypothetical protein J5Y09_14555 [Roseomonas sp. PWR1]|uniref:Uncharacterized protein n=1 Tax=Roseomonas nitratireducens TaxID=2820810 RepID=A0ABS4AUV1_9PROT|nr:hypothetical protein [Neoroseomonas nitratireducens]MBP0465143.1 hypothetical protein [Neoroseomonas nitratireducens]